MQTLNNLSLSEPLVDCENCKVAKPLSRDAQPRPYKCCTYQPFWSALLVGERLASQKPMPQFPLGTVFLPVGVVPPVELRRRQEEMLPSERAQAPGMLCPYAQSPKDVRCSIFEHRPLECRRYYCASQSPYRDKYRDKVFAWSQSVQAETLRDVLLRFGYNQEDWQAWADYLENPGWRNPAHRAFSGRESAESFYLKILKDLQEYSAGVVPPNFSVLLQGDVHKRAPKGKIHIPTPTEIGGSLSGSR